MARSDIDDGFTLDPVAYERMGSVFREAKAKAPLFGHEPLRQVGLYFSSKTRDWYGRDDPQRYFRSFTGTHRVLVESHIPVGFYSTKMPRSSACSSLLCCISPIRRF